MRTTAQSLTVSDSALPNGPEPIRVARPPFGRSESIDALRCLSTAQSRHAAKPSDRRTLD